MPPWVCPEQGHNCHRFCGDEALSDFSFHPWFPQDKGKMPLSTNSPVFSKPAFFIPRRWVSFLGKASFPVPKHTVFYPQILKGCIANETVSCSRHRRDRHGRPAICLPAAKPSMVSGDHPCRLFPLCGQDLRAGGGQPLDDEHPHPGAGALHRCQGRCGGR